MQGSGQIIGGTPYSEQSAGPLMRGQGVPEEDGTLPVIVPTVLQLSRDSLAYWNNMTCFFNKWWYPEADRITLPFCFFHITKYSESHSLETSQKRLILYEPPEQKAEESIAKLMDPVRPGLMQTVTDNVVVNPKEYNIEAIVPFMPFGRYVRQGVWTAENVLSSFGEIGKNLSESTKAYLTEQMASANMMAQHADKATTYMDGVTESASPLEANQMINKNSLDAMFERGNIVQFKTWLGFEYKYVIILNKTLEKRGIEDDVWRVSMTLRELPILSLERIKSTVTPVLRTWTVGAADAMGKLSLGNDNISKTIPAMQKPKEEA